MATGTIQKTQVITYKDHTFTSINISARTNYTLTTSISGIIGTDYSKVICVYPLSDAGFSGAVYTLFLNQDTLYMKSDLAASSGTLGVRIVYRT